MISNSKLRKLSLSLVSDPNNCMDCFQKNLLMYLNQKDLTLAELAELADISQSTLKSFVYGEPKDCHISNVIKIAKALNISVDELMGCETFDPKIIKTIQTARQLPNSFIYFIRWISDYYFKELYENRVSEKSVPVMTPICGDNSNLQMTNKFDIVDISCVNSNIVPKIFMGIRIPCDMYVPDYFPGDILLLANDRNPRLKENFLICTEKNIWISHKKGDDYYSSRDESYRLGKNEISVEIGYVADVIKSRE